MLPYSVGSAALGEGKERGRKLGNTMSSDVH
jgi:hypothetical protein